MSWFNKARSKPAGLYRTCWASSCDFCAYQEGRHFCNLHSKQVKNMDTVKCADWMDMDAGITIDKEIDHE